MSMKKKSPQTHSKKIYGEFVGKKEKPPIDPFKDKKETKGK